MQSSFNITNNNVIHQQPTSINHFTAPNLTSQTHIELINKCLNIIINFINERQTLDSHNSTKEERDFIDSIIEKIHLASINKEDKSYTLEIDTSTSIEEKKYNLLFKDEHVTISPSVATHTTPVPITFNLNMDVLELKTQLNTLQLPKSCIDSVNYKPVATGIVIGMVACAGTTAINAIFHMCTPTTLTANQLIWPGMVTGCVGGIGSTIACGCCKENKQEKVKNAAPIFVGTSENEGECSLLQKETPETIQS